jgi:malate dehydrogenase
MVEAILKDKNLVIPAAAYMRGEYGLKDIFFGVPVQLGRQGLVKVWEYQLDEQEGAALLKSAEAVRQTIAALHSLVKI